VWVCGCVCGSVTTKTRNCVHRSSPNWLVGKGSDHIQLIEFWPSRAPWKGVCSGMKIFGSALLQPALRVCVSPSAFSFTMLLFHLLARYQEPVCAHTCAHVGGPTNSGDSWGRPSCEGAWLL